MASPTKVQKHVKQRFALKVLRYYAGQRDTDPAATDAWRMGMTEQAAEKQKENIRNLILMAAANIRAGRR